MEQIRVPISALATVMSDLMGGKWPEVATNGLFQTAD
jgi:hypothetical protein